MNVTLARLAGRLRQRVRSLLLWLAPPGSRRQRLRIQIGRLLRGQSNTLDQPAPPKPGAGVNLLAHFCYPSGLQVAAMNTRDALTKAGWDVSCRDVPNNARTDLPTREQFLGLHPYPITLVQVAPEPLGRNAYVVAGLAERKVTYRIGYWYWELETVPTSWKRQKEWLHELWAPTRFVAEALRRVMPMPVFEMLPGIAPPPIIETPRSTFGLPDGEFLFLYAFDMSSTRERKNPDAAIAAFRRAFAPTDAARLVLKISRGWEDPQALAELDALTKNARITIIDRVMPPNDYFALVNCCDAYLSLHRSEGFGLTIAEAMALGKPAIATRYSGNLDFMDDSNSLLVDFRLIEIPKTTKSYAHGARWAEPSIDDAAEKMRALYREPARAQELGERGQQCILTTLSLDAAATRMIARLREIYIKNG